MTNQLVSVSVRLTKLLGRNFLINTLFSCMLMMSYQLQAMDRKLDEHNMLQQAEAGNRTAIFNVFHQNLALDQATKEKLQDQLWKLAKVDDAEAQYLLAKQYLDSGSTKEGMQWLKEAANLHQLDALFALGGIYEKGIGDTVKADTKLAQQCYEEGWNSYQHLPSALQLARLCLREKDQLAKAMSLLEMLVKQQNGEAAFTLAEYYSDHGKNLSNNQVFYYYEQSLSYGYPYALEKIQTLAKQEEGGVMALHLANTYVAGRKYITANTCLASQWFAVSVRKGNRKALLGLTEQGEKQGNFLAAAALAKLYREEIVKDTYQCQKWQLLANNERFVEWQNLLANYRYTRSLFDQTKQSQAYWQAGEALYRFYGNSQLSQDMLTVCQELAQTGSVQAQHEVEKILQELKKKKEMQIPNNIGMSDEEKKYSRFYNGKLIYKPKEGSDEGKIELPIAALANPLEGTFDLSRCGDVGQYLSINTGYRKGKKQENANKLEIWFAPRFLVEKEINGTAKHFQAIIGGWAADALVGIMYTWGNWDNLDWYDYMITMKTDEIKENLYEIWKKSDIMDDRARPRARYATSNTHGRRTCKKFHVVYDELN